MNGIDTSPVVGICQDLIRIDTQNFGPDPRTRPEAEAADYVIGLLRSWGYETETYESEPGRVSVLVRVAGANPELPALIVHGHLDVVPAPAEEWSVDPFGGVIKDGYLWGRGAVDMKNMDAMMLVCLKDMAERGWRPRRPMIFAFFADEEAGGLKGAKWMVANHPEAFAGASHAISEVGGYSVEVGGRRVYLIQTGEKGLRWLTLSAKGTAGHGSVVNEDNAITRIASAISRIGSHRWPLHLTDTVRALLRQVAELTDRPYAEDPQTVADLVSRLGVAEAFVAATLTTRANPTQLTGGYKVNVIPGDASAGVDLRPVPGEEESALATIAELAGEGIELSTMHADPGYESPFDAPIVEEMSAALLAEDPEAIIAPYLLSAGTDNKALAPLGITGYGFVPLALPADFDFPAMFHGVDERIPLEALHFGTRVLARFLAAV
ncbi:MAG: M20/M25/M40 family metallo-hydrolase [Flaviflexus sp.]|nr:M20/M25/M40 family metallo-hydrolase [Flaviflexus sp.]